MDDSMEAVSVRLGDVVAETYLRERSRYADLIQWTLDDIASARRRIATDELPPFTVTSRLKDPDSLRRKIRDRAPLVECRR